MNLKSNNFRFFIVSFFVISNVANAQFVGEAAIGQAIQQSGVLSSSSVLGGSASATAVGDGVAGAGLNAAGTPLLENPWTYAAGAVLIGMAVLAFAQGGADSSTAGQAFDTAHNANGSGTGGPGAGSADPTASKDAVIAATEASKAKLNATLSKLAAKGLYDKNAKTIKINGKDIKMSAFSTPESMIEAGVPKAAVDQAMATFAKIEKNLLGNNDKITLGALTNSNGYEEGGGSGKGGGAGDASSGAGDSGYGAGGLGASSLGRGRLGAGREPSALAGLQKNYNGDPIGVAADSIFAMMNRRYKVKESQDAFLNAAEAAIQK